MADYEVLAPGGHARLVSDVKSYADRAGGKGTTQLADGSVTRDKLADGVTDRIDAMRDRCDPLVGNHFFNELAEGTVLTTDDAYAAPPKGVEVFGKSTQSGTPTPDAPVEIKSVDDLTLHVCGKNVFDVDNAFLLDGYFDSDGHIRPNTNFKTVAIKVVPNTTYTLQMTRFTSLSAATLAMWLFSETPETSTSGVHGTRSIVINYPTTVSGGYHYEGQVTTDADTKYICISIGNVNDYNVSDSLATLQLEYGTTATPYVPYVGASVSIPLSNNVARSLPDGTRDELVLSYIGPSETEGWGVFGVELNKQTESATFDGTETWVLDINDRLYTEEVSSSVKKPPSNQVGIRTNCSMGVWSSINNLQSSANRIAVAQSGRIFINLENITTVAQITALLQETPMQFDYPLATPQTIDLGTVELPVNPAPDLTAWADGGSAQPTISMNYEQDINIVIARLEAAIADLATA